MSTLQFTMPSSIDAIGPMMERLAPVLSRNLPPDQDAQVDLAVREALANAVIHGNGQDSGKNVHVAVRPTCNRATHRNCVDVIVRDEGRGFDPDAVANPLADEGLLSGHGRGVYLMRALMDEVRFAKGGRQVHMRKTGTS